MPNAAYRWTIRAFALLAPIYFIYHPVLHTRPSTPTSRSLWRFTAAGFCLYLVAALVLLGRGDRP